MTERFPDGRLNIVIEGGRRFRLVELTEGRSFATARVEPVGDQDDPAGPDEIGRALALFDQLVGLVEADPEPPEPENPELSFAIAGRFEFSPDLKQELLDEKSERVRLLRLCEVLVAAAETVERAALVGKLKHRR